MDTNKLHNLAISDSGFIFDPETGNSYTTNETGAIIINKLKKGHKVSEISALLLEDYEVSPDEVELDIVNMLETLKNNNLL